MTRKTKRRIRRVVIALVTLYVVGGVFLYFFQEIFLFHPQPLPQEHQFLFSQSFTEQVIKDKDKSSLHFVKFKTENRKGIALYFHGNKRNVERFAVFSEIFTKHGYEVWMPDYRGFGKSTGSNSEKKMYEDALLVYQLARKEVNSDDIVIYGKSLGSGVAAQLASLQPCKMLLLETPYYSMKQMAKQWVPFYPSAIMRYHFPTNIFIKKVTAPITVFHGTGDGVISYSHSVKLKRENPTIELITIEGGAHNNLPDAPAYQQTLVKKLSD